MDTKNFNFLDRIIAKSRLNKVIDFVSDNDSILDFGCGSKSYLLEIIKNSIKKGIGLDYDVNDRVDGNIEYIKHKFNGTLPFRDNTFDKIFLLAVLEHIEINQVENLFKEFNRILKKKGLVILTTPTLRNKSLLEFLAYKLKVISSAEIRDHKKYYNFEDIGKLADSCEFEMKSYRLFQFKLNSRIIFEKKS